MDERLGSILRGIASAELDFVAASVLGTPSPKRSAPTFSEIQKPHNDARTIGIVKVSGTATASGLERRWSAVAKVIDLGVPRDPRAFVSPENEEVVYERRLFADDGVPFRPARCYRVSRPSPQVKVIWLEDLTGAAAPPFDLQQLTAIAHALGRWNGVHHARPPALPFAIPANSFITRLERSRFGTMIAELEEYRDHPYTRQAYGDLPLSLAAELHDTLTVLDRRTGTLPGSLAFGDCNVGNLFWNERETVAIDWASLCDDPIGVDAGCVVGSAVTYGRHGAAVAENERMLFDSYVDGLAETGWKGNRDDARRAYFGLFGVYLMYTALMPAVLPVPGKHFPRAFYEQRYQTRWEEIGALVHSTIRLIPSFIAEMRNLQ